MTMPAGTYWIGDLCYVMHDRWDEVCSLLFADRDDHDCNQGEFKLKDGTRFAMYNTAYGDGEYTDNHGNSYGVDSGSIGCILLSDICLGTSPDSSDNDVSLGTIVEFKRPVDSGCEVDQGLIWFSDRATRVAIETDAQEEEDDYEDYEDEEEEV